MANPLEYEELELVHFVGSNIPQDIKNILEVVNPGVLSGFENDDQREAYKLGVRNTMSLLRQILDQYLVEDQVVFYYPETEVSEEMRIDEIIEWAGTL